MTSLFYCSFSIATIALYFIAASIQYFDRLSRLSSLRFINILALILHALWLYHVIDLPVGQDINLLNMLSLVTWLMGIIIVVTSSHKTSRNLSILIFPLAAFSILATLFFPTYPTIRVISGHPGQLIHIWLCAVTFSIICIAALQAILLTVQDLLLHRHYLPKLVKKMPALESMEYFLFQMIGIGFILLTLVCISSAYFFANIFQQPLLKKTLLAFIAWGVLCVLLLGRYLFGWRGRKALAYIMSGFVLLVIVYCSAYTL